MSQKLTREFIATRVKHDKIETLKSINFWGNDLEEISILSQMQNLQVISLSVNRIKTLKDFSRLKNLKELYLRKNNISDFIEINYLSTCPNLKVLWLSENPISNKKNYRLTVISYLPNLEKLDDKIITEEEKLEALRFSSSDNDIDNYENCKNLEYDYDMNKKENFTKSKNNFQLTTPKKKGKKSINIDKEIELNEKLNNNEYDISEDFYRKNSLKSNNSNSFKKKLKVNLSEKYNKNPIYDSEEYFQNEKFSYKEKENLRKDSYNQNLTKRISSENINLNSNRNSIDKRSEFYDNYDNYEYENQSQNNFRKKEQLINNSFSRVSSVCNEGNRTMVYQSRNENIVNSILLLMKEVSETDLNFIRNELDRKLGYY